MSADNEVLWIVTRFDQGYYNMVWIFRTREAARLFVDKRSKKPAGYTYTIKRAKWGPEQ